MKSQRGGAVRKAAKGLHFPGGGALVGDDLAGFGFSISGMMGGSGGGGGAGQELDQTKLLHQTEFSQQLAQFKSDPNDDRDAK